MKLQNKDLRHIEKSDSRQDPAAISGSLADVAGSAHSEREIPVIPGKRQGFSRPMFVITGVALCMGLSSCFLPHDSYGGRSTTTITTYQPGYRVTSLPGGYRREVISGNTYYYHDGYYYRRGSGGYVVVDAPRDSRYYEDYNRRHRTHQSSRHDQRYQRGEVITRLPHGYRVVNHRGKTYYQAGDRYYRRDNNNYVIVSRPY